MITTSPARLSKADRRHQLLDAAAQLLTERGAAGLTMEGLAAAAGVSKALPYAHFDNADAVQVALYQREVFHLGAAVLDAVEPAPRGDGQIMAAIGAYFDFVGERGAVLSVLMASHAREALDPEVGPTFVGQLLLDNFDLDPGGVNQLGALIIGCLTTATAMWSQRLGNRSAIEATVTAFVLAGIHRMAGGAERTEPGQTVGVTLP